MKNYILFFLLFLVISCKDETVHQVDNLEIHDTYLNLNLSSKLKNGELRIIRSQNDLLGIAPEKELEESGLLNIDFSKETLLLGKSVSKYSSINKYSFCKQNESLCILNLQRTCNNITVDTLEYGFVVSLLPSSMYVKLSDDSISSADTYYYYYNGQKIPIRLLKDKLLALTVRNNDKGHLKLHSNSNIRGIYSSKDYNFYEINLSVNSLDEYNQMVNELKGHSEIDDILPSYEVENKSVAVSKYFYVKLKNSSDSTFLFDLAQKYSLSDVKRNSYMPLWYTLRVPSGLNYNALDLANIFYETGHFQFSEPDFLVDNICFDSNPLYDIQWGINNTGQSGGAGGFDINVVPAWNISTGENIKVAVIDEGLQFDHPDLQDNISLLSYDTETNSSPSNVYGEHGIACGGIIAAVDNTIGLKGVAYGAELMSVSNTLIYSESIKEKLANGINWSWMNGADIISNSWGSNSLQSNLINDAINNALSKGRNGKGCLLVFAAGNDNSSSVSYPSNLDGVISVGAMSMCGERKSFSSCDGVTNWGSNYGSDLDLVAPGVQICTTWSGSNYNLSFSGTSAACPHVAGILALILEVNPDLTYEQIISLLCESCVKLPDYYFINMVDKPYGTWDNEVGYGLPDAFKAVFLAKFGSDLYIVGPTQVVGNTTYSLSIPIPEGAVVSWSLSGLNDLKIVSSTNESVTLTSSQAYYQGTSSTLKASISYKGGVIEVKKEVENGNALQGYYRQYANVTEDGISTPAVDLTPLDYTQFIYPYATTIMSTGIDPRTVDVEFDLQMGVSPLYYVDHRTGAYEFKIPANSPPVVFNFKSKTTGTIRKVLFFGKDLSHYSIMYNGMDKVLDIEHLDSNSQSQSVYTRNTSVYDVSLMDLSTLKYVICKQFKGKKFSLDISSLPCSSYIVKIEHNGSIHYDKVEIK